MAENTALTSAAVSLFFSDIGSLPYFRSGHPGFTVTLPQKSNALASSSDDEIHLVCLFWESNIVDQFLCQWEKRVEIDLARPDCDHLIHRLNQVVVKDKNHGTKIIYCVIQVVRIFEYTYLV